MNMDGSNPFLIAGNILKFICIGFGELAGSFSRG